MTALEQEWFRVWQDQPNVWIIEEPLHSEQVKSYLVLGRERAALIDTGMGVGNLQELVEARTELPIIVLQSHAHNDHVGSAWQFDDVAIHQSEAAALAAGQSAERLARWFAPSEMSGPLPIGFNPVGYSIPGKEPTSFLRDGDLIDLGGTVLQVLHCPGHSAGGLVFFDRAQRTLFSTDVVYLRQLYLLNPDSSVADYVASLDRLAALAPHIDRLYPSHGPSPIEPDWIPKMAEGMVAILRGRRPDRTELLPAIEGGRQDVPRRSAIEVHDFGEFEVLIGKWKTGE
jgi:glyoxylase-like metal-dependent hydrolase (beta-lactamase superfamily II)